MFIVAIAAELFAILVWTSAADASSHFRGLMVTWESTSDSFSLGLQPGWLVIAAVAAAFVLGSRPWLAVSRRHDAASV